MFDIEPDTVHFLADKSLGFECHYILGLSFTVRAASYFSSFYVALVHSLKNPNVSLCDVFLYVCVRAYLLTLRPTQRTKSCLNPEPQH